MLVIVACCLFVVVWVLCVVFSCSVFVACCWLLYGIICCTPFVVCCWLLRVVWLVLLDVRRCVSLVGASCLFVVCCYSSVVGSCCLLYVVVVRVNLRVVCCLLIDACYVLC